MLLSKGGLVGSTDRALIRQLGGYPTALGTVAVLMALFAFIPGLPFVPFLIGAVSLGGAAWLARETKAQRGRGRRGRRPRRAAPAKKSLGDLLDVDEIHMEFAPNLVPVVMDEATGLDARIAQHAQPHRHRVRADPAGDPADRQSGPAARHLRDPHPGGRGGAQRASRPTRCWCCCPTRTPPAPDGPLGGRAGLRRAGALDRAGAAGGGGADGPLGGHPDRGGGDASARDRQGELRPALHPPRACASCSTSSPRSPTPGAPRRTAGCSRSSSPTRCRSTRCRRCCGCCSRSGSRSATCR